jgi:GNAT superfamily N-acetyltransferase
MNRNNLSSQFYVTHDKLDKGSHSLTLSNMDSDNLARVSFDHYTDPTMDRPSRIEVDYLKSHREGQGHAKALMQHVYDRYPKSFIDWGLTIHPAATHLASQFEDKYYDRTAYEPNHDEYVEGTEGMYSGEPGY